MTRLSRPDAFAFLTICLAGCASSPIVAGDWSDDSEVDGGFESIEGMMPEPSDDDEPGVDPNATPSGGSALGTPGNTQRPDAAASSGTDAGRTPRDASAPAADVKDPGAPAVGVTDAGAKDAGAKDAGRPDSGATSTPTPAKDGGGQAPARPAAGSCRTASDCTESCVPLGIFNCCKANGSCGCTWAIGAYCQ